MCNTSFSGFRVRTRSVIKESSVESDSCPHVSEAMTCDDPVCFQWRVTSQGPCVSQNGLCGPGFQEQTLECLIATGLQLTGSFFFLFFTRTVDLKLESHDLLIVMSFQTCRLTFVHGTQKESFCRMSNMLFSIQRNLKGTLKVLCSPCDLYISSH